MIKPYKLIAILLILATVSFPMAGCQRTGEQATVDKLLSFLQNAEYPRIYQLLTREARESITLVELSRRYDEIYRSIGLVKAVCRQTGIKDVDEDNKTVLFSMTVSAEKLGEFTMEMDAPLRWENGGWFVGWTPELILPGLENGDKAVLKPMPASRGEIFDVNGEVLAKNDFALSVCVDSSKVKNYETLIRLLAPKLGMTEADVRNKLEGMMKKASAWYEDDSEVPPEAAGISGATATPKPTPSPSPSLAPMATATASAGGDGKGSIKVVKAYPKDGLTYTQQQELLEIPGVGIDDSTWTVIRYYPYGNLLAQTLGYTGVMSQEDLLKPENAGLKQDAVIGKEGLEKAFESYLRGQCGYELYIEDSEGERKTTLAHKAGADGRDLRLTIDIRLQQRAEMLLREYLTQEMAGSIVVLDPKTGYIQAMASIPSFDPNLFSFPVSPDVMKYLTDPDKTPLYNRATRGLYPPGSTFKPFTASMGLTDRKISTSFVFPHKIENNLWMPSSDDWDWEGKAIKRKDPTPGKLNLANAITHSDNIFFAYTAMKVGGASFYNHCLELGIGLDSERRMKFDLPLAASQISNSGRIENLRLLADSGYGQGEFGITPVQMAALFGALGNGGDIMQPRIVQSICHTEGPRYVTDKSNPPEVWKEGVIPDNNLNVILPSLKKVAQVGTAKDLNRYKNLKDFEIAAKTGTAEIGNDKTREIAWIIGFTTKEMDRLVCVTIEVPADKGSIRTEIAKRMFEE